MSDGERHNRQIVESAEFDVAGLDASRTAADARRHPAALHEIARRRLMAGNAAGAHEILQEAVRHDPGDVDAWLNLAAALRGLQRVNDEMAAIDKALEIEPRNLRALLQRASLHEIQGLPRAAAATYRTALQIIPRGAEPPPSIQPVLLHAKRAVEANDLALENFLEDRLKHLRRQFADQPLARFDQCLATLLRKHRIYRQQPTFMYFPHLPSIEFYERSDFPWLDSIEAAADDIRAELVNLLADGPAVLDPYVAMPKGVPVDQWRELNYSRRWGVYYLWREGTAIAEHIARFPRTVAALNAWPRCEVPGCGPTAVFSILDANTRIPPHTGVTNTRLIVHLPLIVPPGCGFRVGARQREWQPGKAFVFDDTIEHEAWNNSNVPRAVLILDIWSPYLTQAEREMVSSATAAVGEYYGVGSYRGV